MACTDVFAFNFAIVLTVKTILLQTQIATPATNQYSNLFAQSTEFLSGLMSVAELGESFEI